MLVHFTKVLYYIGMDEMYQRTQMLIGDKIDVIKGSSVIVFGLGGVGGCVVEALARVGVGAIALVDCDVISKSNLNRQLLATLHTIGKNKTDVAKARIESINPDCKVDVFNIFYSEQTKDAINLQCYDYVVDAIDTVSSKLLLISIAKELNVPIISCMGTGNKLGGAFEVEDIFKTSVCPLAKVMRKELKARGIKSLKVVYSKEEPIIPKYSPTENGRHIPGCISYAPAIAGFTLAGEVIRDLLKTTN